MRVIIILCLIFLSSSWHHSFARTTQENYHRTLILPVSAKNSKSPMIPKINSRIREKLSTDKNFIPADTKKPPPCNSQDCALELAKTAKADRLIYGILIEKNKKTIRALGNEGAAQYLLMGTDAKSYSLRIFIIDVRSGKPLESFSFISGEPGFEKKLEGVISQIQKHYQKYPDTEKLKVETTSNSVHVACGAGILMFKSTGAFSEIAPRGYGLEGFFSLSGLILEADIFRLSIEVSPLASTGSNIGTYSYLNYTLSAGYIFDINPLFSLAPFAGAGLIHHKIAEKGEEANWFNDPLIIAGVECLYHYSDKIDMYLRPQLDLFFEKNNTGRFASLHLGAVYNFN